MDKELKKLLDNYIKVIQGEEFPINPSPRQLNLLLIYIRSSSQQIKKQQETIEKSIAWVENNKYYFPEPTELLNILKGGEECNH